METKSLATVPFPLSPKAQTMAPAFSHWEETTFQVILGESHSRIFTTRFFQINLKGTQMKLKPEDEEAKELSTAPKGLILVVKEPGKLKLVFLHNIQNND